MARRKKELISPHNLHQSDGKEASHRGWMAALPKGPRMLSSVNWRANEGEKEMRWWPWVHKDLRGPFLSAVSIHLDILPFGHSTGNITLSIKEYSFHWDLHPDIPPYRLDACPA